MRGLFSALGQRHQVKTHTLSKARQHNFANQAPEVLTGEVIFEGRLAHVPLDKNCDRHVLGVGIRVVGKASWLGSRGFEHLTKSSANL